MKKAYEPIPINAGITGFVLQIVLIAFAELTRRLFGLSKRSKTHVDETIGLTGDNDEDSNQILRQCRFPIVQSGTSQSLRALENTHFLLN